MLSNYSRVELWDFDDEMSAMVRWYLISPGPMRGVNPHDGIRRIKQLAQYKLEAKPDPE